MRRHKPDTVIIDVSLPDLDDITLGRLIRHSWHELPIVFATGHDDYEGMTEATANARTGCIQKPFSIESLEAMLRSWRGGLKASAPAAVFERLPAVAHSSSRVR